MAINLKLTAVNKPLNHAWVAAASFYEEIILAKMVVDEAYPIGFYRESNYNRREQNKICNGH